MRCTALSALLIRVSKCYGTASCVWLTSVRMLLLTIVAVLQLFELYKLQSGVRARVVRALLCVQMLVYLQTVSAVSTYL
jgi:hypothetical protein